MSRTTGLEPSSSAGKPWSYLLCFPDATHSYLFGLYDLKCIYDVMDIHISKSLANHLGVYVALLQ